MKDSSKEQNIEVYARLRPVSKTSSCYNVENDFEQGSLHYSVPKPQEQGIINNARESYSFKFRRVFEQSTKQDEIFENVAKPCCQAALDGFNSTVFAYGQTGSGKTWTINGGPENFEDRGVIPRSISYLYDEIEKREDEEISVEIEYLEIYNNHGYDLLVDRDKDISQMPSISFQEDSAGHFFFNNLSRRSSRSEEDALNLLFLGGLNRVVRETALNERSTRSHCIFTINISSKKHGSDIVRRSKLHLVDLAGSERVSKTNSEGKGLAEAKHINVSLHFLEQVIKALASHDSHIPYRNSILTCLLRDSLGGNCKTAMIATLNPDPNNIWECISTCRFSQRVALIKQTATINEQLDPMSLIRRLKKENKTLREELAFYRSDVNDSDILSSDERSIIQQKVDAFLRDEDLDSVIELQGDPRRIREAFKMIKQQYRKGRPNLEEEDAAVEKDGDQHTYLKKPKEASEHSSAASADRVDGSKTQESIDALKEALRERDLEIGILLDMVEKHKRSNNGVNEGIQTSHRPVSPRSTEDMSSTDSTPTLGPITPSSRGSGDSQEKENDPPHISDLLKSRKQQLQQMLPSHVDIDALLQSNVMKDRMAALEVFQKNYGKYQVMDQQSEDLRSKVKEAKELASRMNESRNHIEGIKKRIKQLRVEKAMQGLIDKDGTNENDDTDPEEEQLRQEIRQEKSVYKERMHALKKLKSEILYLENQLSQMQVEVQKDFDRWYMLMREQQGLLSHSSASSENNKDTESNSKHQDNASVISSWSSHNSFEVPVPSGRTSVDSSHKNNSYNNNNTRLDYTQHEPPLTGDEIADKEIRGFYAARNKLLQGKRG